MIPTTATANPAPWRSDRSVEASSIGGVRGALAGGVGDRHVRRAARVGTGENANGITISDTNGATAIPSATAAWPEPIPTATASANRNREVDSRNTSPPYSAKRWWPASQPRAK